MFPIRWLMLKFVVGPSCHHLQNCRLVLHDVTLIRIIWSVVIAQLTNKQRAIYASKILEYKLNIGVYGSEGAWLCRVGKQWMFSSGNHWRLHWVGCGHWGIRGRHGEGGPGGSGKCWLVCWVSASLPSLWFSSGWRGHLWGIVGEVVEGDVYWSITVWEFSKVFAVFLDEQHWSEGRIHCAASGTRFNLCNCWIVEACSVSVPILLRVRRFKNFNLFFLFMHLLILNSRFFSYQKVVISADHQAIKHEMPLHMALPCLCKIVSQW